MPGRFFRNRRNLPYRAKTGTGRNPNPTQPSVRPTEFVPLGGSIVQIAFNVPVQGPVADTKVGYQLSDDLTARHLVTPSNLTPDGLLIPMDDPTLALVTALWIEIPGSLRGADGQPISARPLLNGE